MPNHLHGKINIKFIWLYVKVEFDLAINVKVNAANYEI